jgi:hypothetical protein
MDAVALFGLITLTAEMICYTLEDRSPWFVFAFAVGCAGGSAYGFMLHDGWPFGVIEAVWCIVSFRRWRMRLKKIGVRVNQT